VRSRRNERRARRLRTVRMLERVAPAVNRAAQERAEANVAQMLAWLEDA